MQTEIILTHSEQIEIEKGLYVLRLHLECNHKHKYLVDMDRRNDKEIKDFFQKGKHTEALVCPICKITVVHKN